MLIPKTTLPPLDEYKFVTFADNKAFNVQKTEMDRFQVDFKKQPIRVGLYDIEETIGKGNFAVVKMARHRITKSRVAVKIIDKSHLDEANLKKVYREVQIMKLLQHPHVLKLYQVIETDSMLYIITEYATKGEMFAHVDKHGKLSEPEARRLFWQILSAVDYCHKRKVVHRDLKTENLLLDDNLNVKIADFGFSNYTKENEFLKTWCGSPPYAAPEIFEGKEYSGPAIDIWSLGVVLYVLVCAALPFDGETVHEVRDRVLEGRFRVPYYMSSDLEDLIRKILVKNPTQRYTLNQIKGHPWLQDFPEEMPQIFMDPMNNSYLNLKPQIINGELNQQVLQLMARLGIDIAKTERSLSNNAYDHQTAIYHLLSERLRQHRTSYPEQKNVSTRMRRASHMADQVIARNNRQIRLPSTTSVHRASVHPGLQYAINELHIGDINVPTDLCNSNVPGCIKEFVPPPQHTFSPRQTTHYNSPGSNSQIETVNEEGGVAETPTVRQQRRERRSAVDAMTCSSSRRHTVQGSLLNQVLYVPANHPLLRQETTEIPPEYQNQEVNKLKIQIVDAPVSNHEQTSTSLILKREGTMSFSPISHKNVFAFNEGRRASDGVNAPFRHLMHKSDNQYLKEYEELQKLIQHSLIPENLHQHRRDQFREYGNNNNSMYPEWKTSPLSSQNELMKTLQSMHLVNQESSVSDIECDSWNTSGQLRRPAPYRKVSGGVSPIPAHIRRRRTPVIGESPFTSFDSSNGMED